ncbi:MAG: DNA repair protein RecO [Kiritimatiellia bacterium]
MAGEIVKTRGIVLAIHPWSRTSHVVAWLTPDHGVVTTLVKGAVRPKSAFLGQYDLFYTCDLLYYARASGELHALREVTPLNLREHLRGRWRETSLADYAADLVRALAPPGGESGAWFDFLDGFLDRLVGSPAGLVLLEMEILRLAGVTPDFSAMAPHAEWTPFAVDLGRCGEGARTLRLSPRTVAALRRPDAATTPPDALSYAVRFLGVFLAFHLEQPPNVRRALVALLTAPRST